MHFMIIVGREIIKISDMMTYPILQNFYLYFKLKPYNLSYNRLLNVVLQRC